jgi:hypothetical protein
MLNSNPSYQDQQTGTSLVEMIVAGFILCILCWLLFVGLHRAEGLSRSTKCLSNLRQIHQAIMLYRVEYQAYPLPREDQTLQDLVKPWLGNFSSIFNCPEDNQKKSDSYSYFYAPRSIFTDAESYIIGCPRHDKYTHGVAVFAGGNTEIPSLTPIFYNGASTHAGVERSDGQFLFSDGSTVNLSLGKTIQQGPFKKKSSRDNQDTTPQGEASSIAAILSYKQADGKFYSVVKFKDGAVGKASFSIIPGNRFEVITSSAIIAVRGTKFTVETFKKGGKQGTRIEVTSGVVDLQPVSKGKGLRVGAGKKASAMQGEEPSDDS